MAFYLQTLWETRRLFLQWVWQEKCTPPFCRGPRKAFCTHCSSDGSELTLWTGNTKTATGHMRNPFNLLSSSTRLYTVQPFLPGVTPKYTPLSSATQISIVRHWMGDYSLCVYIVYIVCIYCVFLKDKSFICHWTSSLVSTTKQPFHVIFFTI